MAQAADRSLPDPPKAPSPAPFIVTAELPPDVLAWADSLRRRHYPPERNWLSAHVTLFHSFSPSLREELPRFLARMAGEFAAPEASVSGLMDLGQGTALAIRSPAMLAIRDRIAEHFWQMLTRQDQGSKTLHITIQNKVTREAARTLQAELASGMAARRFTFTGLGLHLYRGPHWETVRTWRFRGKEGG